MSSELLCLIDILYGDDKPELAGDRGERVTDLVMAAIGLEASEVGERTVAHKVWTRLEEAGLTQQKKPGPPAREPMNQARAEAMGRSLMPWGAHQGTPIGDIDWEYLAFLVDDTPFKRDLRAYLDYRGRREPDE